MATRMEPERGSYRTPSIEHATVADAMRSGVMTCEPDVPAIEVARMMATHHIHCVVIEGIHKERGHGERLVWGVVSHMDLVRAIDADTLDLSAAEIGATEPVTVDRSMPLKEAIGLMARHGATHLIVIEDQRPVGVISTLDVAGVLAWGRA